MVEAQGVPAWSAAQRGRLARASARNGCATGAGGPRCFSSSAARPIAMMAVPIEAEPKVTTKPNSNSPSAVPGEASGKNQMPQAAGIERQQPADHQRRQRPTPMARLIASRRNSGTRRKRSRRGRCAARSLNSCFVIGSPAFAPDLLPESWGRFEARQCIGSRAAGARLASRRHQLHPSVQRAAGVVGVGADRRQLGDTRGAQPRRTDAIVLHQLRGGRLGAASRQIEIVGDMAPGCRCGRR